MICRPDWGAPIVPGESMMGISIGTRESEVLNALRAFGTSGKSADLIRIPGAPNLIMDQSEPGVLILRAADMPDVNYAWQNEAACFVFEGAALKCIIVTSLPDGGSMQYQGRMDQGIGLGSRVADLKMLCDIEFDPNEEFFYSTNHVKGMTVVGSGACNLTVDPDQIISSIKVSAS